MTTPTQGTPAPAVAPAPAPGSPEYDAAMATKGAAAAGDPAPAPAGDRPAWLPEKFKTPEDLAKAYGELESKLGQPKPDQKPTTPDQKPDLKLPEDDKAAADAAAAAGFKLSDLQAEFQEHGDVTPESRAKLEKAGFGKDVVDSYIAGQKALAESIEAKVVNAAHEAAGGAEQYAVMAAWAKTGLTPAQQAAYNEAVTTGNPEAVALAVAGLRGRYEAANGTQGTMVGGKPAAGEAAYESWAQVTADMGKPEYQKDPAFRALVERRLAVSDKLGTVQTRT